MSHAHYSRANIKGHPLHSMLVHFPIAFYVSGVVTLVLYAILGNPFWYQASMYLLFAGLGTAVLAALFGTIDLFSGIPAASAARRTGIKHMGLNLGALALFAGAAFSMLDEWGNNPLDRSPEALPYGLPLVLSLIGAALTGVAGGLGSRLVYKHHVGMAEPVAPDAYVADAASHPHGLTPQQRVDVAGVPHDPRLARPHM